MGELNFNDLTKLYLKDADGNVLSAIPESVSLSVDQSQLPTVGSGSCSPLVAMQGSVSWSCAPVSIGCSEINKIDLLMSVMDEHDSSRSDRLDGEGGMHFTSDGDFFMCCALPFGNKLNLFVSGEGDANMSCDKALKCLEKVKERIDELEKRLFELSLNQEVGDGD